MRLETGGLVLAVSELERSAAFYCESMQLRQLASDGTSVMLGPQGSNDPWLLALRGAGPRPLHPGGGATGIRAVFFRTDPEDLDALEARLKGLDGFNERHQGEFYEMVSGYDPDRTALGFWALRPDAPHAEPTFVPPSIYYLN